MIDLPAYCEAWAMARAFEQAALAIVANNPIEALRLAITASGCRAVRT